LIILDIPSTVRNESFSISQQKVDELKKALEREKTGMEKLRWHQELMTDEYNRVLRVAETFQEKFKCTDCDDGKELYCKFQSNHREEQNIT